MFGGKQMKIKQQTYNVVDYDELDNVVHSVFKSNNFCFVADQEARNDSCYSFYVDGNIDDDEYTQQDVQRILDGKTPNAFGAQLYLDLLCIEGHIKSGHYLVKVGW